MYRTYKAQRRYEYMGIDEYRDSDPHIPYPVMTGVRPLKLGREIATALQAAYEAGRRDASTVTCLCDFCVRSEPR